jgi:hypothetical protein
MMISIKEVFPRQERDESDQDKLNKGLLLDVSYLSSSFICLFCCCLYLCLWKDLNKMID